MKPLWLDKIGDYKVEHHEIPRLGNAPYYLMPISTRLGALHTTEGSTIAGAIHAMEIGLQMHKPPDPCHLICGENRIVQTRPIGVQAASMRDPANRQLYVQIENVGYSKQTPYRLIDSTRKPLIQMIAYCALNFGIPAIRPLPFPDDCSDIKGTVWASKTCKRRLQMQAIWTTAKGWVLHLEAPNNVHWDMGAEMVSEILAEAQALIAQ